MVSTRPAARRISTGSVVSQLQLVGRTVERHLPGSGVHAERTRSALYVVGGLQLLLALLYSYLAITADKSLYLAFLPSTNHLFWIPVFVALGGMGLTFIALLGSVSAGWLVALLNLPLALTALYVDNVLLSFALVGALLASAVWLARGLVSDAERRPDPELEP